MANEEVLGPRKTMFVLVIVVGCFAVLWPRILSPLILGSARDQLKPNKFDREAGCCEVMFASEVAVLELVAAVCSSAVGASGQVSPYSVAECRRTVNETCGLDIAAFLKRSENVGKTTKMLLDTLKSSNSSCLRENFGIPFWSLSSHMPLNTWSLPMDKMKQERSPIRGAGPHPALRERGRAIPAGAPTPPSRVPVPLPPHIRVRYSPSPLSVYFDTEVKPPPIPGMRPPLGSPGGPQQAPKSSMGFVMPIYTICIIVFFVYTLSKIVLKRAGTVPYDQVAPDPQFRRRVFRDASGTPEPKFGHKEKDAIVTAISGLVAEVQQQMQTSYDHNQQRQESENHTRLYTNGAVPNTDNTPVRIIATEYIEPSSVRDVTPEPKDASPEPKDASPEPKDASPEPKDASPEPIDPSSDQEDPIVESRDSSLEPKESTPELKEPSEELEDPKEISEEPERELIDHKGSNGDVIKESDDDAEKVTKDFLVEARDAVEKEKQSTPELLEEALKESDDAADDEEEEVEEEEEDEVEPEKSTVKVVGMEVTAHSEDGGEWRPPRPAPSPAARPSHEADEVKSIYLQTEIPQQSKVLIAEFAEDRPERPAPTKHSQSVVSGKMTLSLIQDSPRETPERDAESTVDDYTTASAVTQPAEKKEDELSDDEEIEVEEIKEELVEEEEIEELEEEEEEHKK